MANVIKTVITYPLNGSTRDFQIPFEYLARKFVQVTLIGRDRKELVNIQDYRFTSKTQITTNQTWGVGDGYELIELRRFTSATDRLVDFADGSILRAYDLNVSQIQTLHVAEEARDLTADTIGVNNEGHLDARGRRIVNVADPVNPLDAVNLKTIKEWNDGAYQSYIKAKAEAEKAAQAAAGAKTSETNAYNHMTQAGVSEQRAKASEVAAAGSQSAAANSAANAANSAGSASSSAQQATAAKDYTKQQADRAYNEAERAKGYADSMGNAIDIGQTIQEMNPSTGYVYWKGEHQFQRRVGVSNGYTGSYTARIYMTTENNRPQLGTYDGSNWRTFEMPLENNGRLATREYIHNRVIFADNNTYMKPPEDGKATLLVDNNNVGIYGGSDTNTWLLRVNQSGNSYIYGNMSVRSNVVVRGYSNQSATVGLYMDDAGSRGFISQYIGGKWVGELTLPQASGTLATQQWANANFSKGSKLSGEITGNHVRIQGSGSEMTASGFEAAVSQVPSNAVLCRFVFGQLGSFRSAAPVWRTIS